MGLMETASRLIAKHGQAATLLRPGPGTRDAYGQYIPGPDIEYPVTVLAATYAVEMQLIAGGFLEVGDQRLFLSAEGLTVTPSTTDRLRIGGQVFRTIRVSPLAPAGEVIFWELQVRDE
ncbi:hypothetical protein SAMN05216257_105118 [Meinhardsimonia xiamenensis]|jgi:hypothetical protein|uniref:Uncharacterized protein n=1 Tax=Meinhardsimonia xiamenensis TaxID=990712 RepID=A0A1G9FBJ7_9RHOB|nr:hypothetical protein [Meinhardsimonia xiamenensis]PRX37913.1 hypothetical protein LV81_00185 [Meinhardsimonia xiamenensis]SDK85720.1 hypothetical protein SAMN05216257_105118 [Meinhardsimonia xiamenensis]